jgi:hypothetical protein
VLKNTKKWQVQRLVSYIYIYKGPTADDTDATQPKGLLCTHCDEDEEKDDQFFFTFPSNGAPVE